MKWAANLAINSCRVDVYTSVYLIEDLSLNVWVVVMWYFVIYLVVFS